MDGAVASVKNWIASHLFSETGYSVDLETTDLSQLLKDGTILCQLVMKLKPGSLQQEDWMSSPQTTNDYIYNIGHVTLKLIVQRFSLYTKLFNVICSFHLPTSSLDAFLNSLRTHFSAEEDLLFKPQLLADYTSEVGEASSNLNPAMSAIIPALQFLMTGKWSEGMTTTSSTLSGIKIAPIRRSLVHSDDDLIKHLQRDFFGDIIIPSNNKEYTLSRNLLNKNISALPRLIVRPRTARDVSVAVKFAKLHKWTIDVKSRGNSTTAFGLRNNSLLIDFYYMSGVFWDQRLKIVTVQAGASWADIQRAVSPYLVVAPHDAASGVGSLLSGSTGPLINSHGLPLDLLISAEIIMADGEMRTVKEGQHSAIFWAIRGAGPLSFGIVTSFTLELCDMLVPYGGKVYTCTREWYLNEAPQVLKYCNRLFRSTSFNRSLICDIKFSVEGCIMQNVFLGDPKEGKEEVRFFEVPDITERSVVAEVIPYWKWYAAQAIEDTGQYISTASGFVEALDDEIIEAILNTAQHPIGGFCELKVEFMTGAVTDVHYSQTAYPHRQKLIHLLLITKYRSNLDLWKSWTREFFNKLRKKIVGVNMTYAEDMIQSNEYPRLYWKENYPLLQEIKSNVDQQNFFNYVHGVKPLGSL